MKTNSLLIKLVAAIALGGLLFAVNKTLFHSTPLFAGLGDLPGGKFFSIAKGVSADGTVVVGYSHSAAGMEAFRWTSAGGITGLGFSHASAVAADGSVVVGYRLLGGRVEPVRWTIDGGVESLDTRVEHQLGEACGISANGSTIVGVLDTYQSDVAGRQVASSWTQSAGTVYLEGFDPKTRCSEAHAVSTDGSVVVGASRHQLGHNEAFRFTPESGSVGLGFLPGHTTSIAYGVSADGATVVGCSSDFVTTDAFRWTRETGMVGLGTLNRGRCDSRAYSVSADGSVIVGHSTGENGWEAFIWDANHGMRSVREVLTNEFRAGHMLRGWKLRCAMAVSADGLVVVGFGLNRKGKSEAWMARLTDQPSNAAPVLTTGHQRVASRRSLSPATKSSRLTPGTNVREPDANEANANYR